LQFALRALALAQAHAKEMGHEPTVDADFGSDLEEIKSFNSRKPRNQVYT